MGQTPERKSHSLYDQVLQRLAQAMKKHNQQRTLSDAVEHELEIHDLTRAELDLIQAYLRQDTQWLAGWQAAANQHAQSLHQQPIPIHSEHYASLEHSILSCAHCATEFVWPDPSHSAICPVCGSDIVRIKTQDNRSKVRH